MSEFISGMGKIQDSIEKIVPPTSILQDAFSSLGNIAGDFASWVGDVLTYTLGGLLKDAIEGVIGAIGDMVNATIEAGSQFQTLELRLNNMNFDALVDSGADYNRATRLSIEMTKEQLDWLQKLAATTPYDNTDISTVYSLARAYSFNDAEARTLTADVVNFTASMGLSGDKMESIIKQFGAMESRGKITGTALRTLAQGSFLPLNDILQRIVDNLNKSGEGLTDNSADIAKLNDKLAEYRDRLEIAKQKQSEFTDKTKESTRMANANTIENLRKSIADTTAEIGKLSSESGKLMTVADLMKQISTPEGIPAHLFTEAFQQMIADEPRFENASVKMARTFKSATDNVKDLITSFGGLNIVTPVLDVLGGKIADFMDKFIMSGPQGNELTSLGENLKSAAVDIGKALVNIVTQVLGLMPSVDSLAAGLVAGLQGFANWLTDNQGAIVGKIQEIWNWFANLGNTDFFVNLMPRLKDLYDQFFAVNYATGTTGWEDLRNAIENVAASIGGVLEPFLRDLGLLTKDQKFSLQVFVNALNAVAKWISDNQELLQWLLITFASFVIIQTVTNIVWGFIAGLVGIAATILTVLAATGAMIIIFGVVFSIVTTVITIFRTAQTVWNLFVSQIQLGVSTIERSFQNMFGTVNDIVNRVERAWTSKNWEGVGSAIVQGIANGINHGFQIIVYAAQQAAWNAYLAACHMLGIQSPSKLFAGVGENIMMGMAEGITNSAALAVTAMQNAVGAVAMPALNAPALTQQYTTTAPSAISNTYQSSNAYNLSIHSSAKTEPIIADFNMLQSLAG